jgi:hypothetical protein
MLETLIEQRIAVKGHRRIDERTEVEIGLDAALPHERRAFLEHARFNGVTTDRRDERELVESLGQWDS